MILRRPHLAACALALAAAALQPAQARRDRYRGFQAMGDLRVDTYGYTIDAPDGLTYRALLQQEGVDLTLKGHLLAPGLLQLQVDGAAFALHQLRGGRLENGSRLGLGTKLTLLPWSIFPLTFTWRADRASLGSAGLPGTTYRTDVLGLAWQLTPPKAPRLFLNLQQVGYQSEQDLSALPSTPTGLLGVDGRTRTATATLLHADERTYLRGRYQLTAREDRIRNLGLVDPIDQRLYQQTFDLDGSARLSESTDLYVFGGGRIFDYERGTIGSQVQSFFARSYLRFRPSERLYGNVSYTFNGDSGSDSMGHGLRGLVDYELDSRFGLRGGVLADVADFAGAGLGVVATEAVQGGGYWRTSAGRLQARVEDLVTLGASQVSPGRDGLVVGNAAVAQGSWRLAPFQLLSGSLLANHRLDTSDFGLSSALYGADARWTGSFRGFTNEARVAWYRSAYHDARLPVPTQARDDLRAEARTGGMVDRAIALNSALGYQLTFSERATAPSYSLYVNGGARYVPGGGATLSVDATWFAFSYGTLAQNRLRLLGRASWLFRKLTLDATLEWNLEDQLGLPQTRWVLWGRIQRRFDFGR